MSKEQSDNELLRHADELQREAKKIINELGVVLILKKISEPVFIGSVKNGLMVWHDIDINTYMKELDMDKVAGILGEFALIPTIRKVQFNNYRELRRDHLKDRIRFPHAYYVGLRSIQPSGEWKIDIWFGEKGMAINDYNMPDSSDITREQKITILKLKKAWLDDRGGYKNGVLSVDFYKAVFERNVRNTKEFEDYLRNKR